MVVQDIMTSDPVTVDADAPVSEALRILHDLDVRHVPVTENGALAGMISDRDVRASELKALESAADIDEEPVDPLAAPVAQLMSSNLISVTPEDDITDVIDLMLENKVGAVPVVERHSDTLVGIVSYVDVLREARDLF